MVNIVKPKAELLAYTQLNDDAVDWKSDHGVIGGMDIQDESTDPETLTVLAGRVCYQSQHRPSEATFKDADYLSRTLYQQQHWSIAEHASATIYLTGVSRSLTHELIRHRHLSYSQLSQRFVDESDCNIVVPPAIRDYCTPDGRDPYGDLNSFVQDARKAVEDYTEWAKELQEEAGLPRKQAREAARSVLPNCVETRIVVTGNMRAWNEVIQRRIQPDADAEIRGVAELIRQQLEKVSPVMFKKGTFTE